MLWRVKGQPQTVDLTEFYNLIPEEVYDYVDHFMTMETLIAAGLAAKEIET
jgi:hypothetical protein